MRLFEFGDLSWVPDSYHVCLREYLQFIYRSFGCYKLWIPEFSDFIRRTGSDKYVECCSGSGEAIQLMDSHLSEDDFGEITFLLSDIRPHPEFVQRVNDSHNPRFCYIEQPVDATMSQDEFNHPKIFINSFHHFTPAQVKEILKVNFENGNEVIILESVRNTVLGYISIITSPIILLLTLPFVMKPKFLLRAVFFTYVIPAFPLMFLWDGVVSCMREYSERELRKIVNQLGIPVEMTSKVRRDMSYPAGVSAIYFTFPRGEGEGRASTT